MTSRSRVLASTPGPQPLHLNYVNNATLQKKDFNLTNTDNDINADALASTTALHSVQIVQLKPLLFK